MRQRKQSEGDVYHVVARGTGRQLIFEDDFDRRSFLGILEKGLADHGVELYAWCLMGNHVHLLVRAPIEAVSRLMKQLLGSYAQRFNAKTGRVGHLFQSRFSSEPITDDVYLLTVIRYIHYNPVKGGLGRVDEYPWSSYGEYVGKPKICETAFPLEVCGGVDSFKRLHERPDKDAKCLDVDDEANARKSFPDARAMSIAQQVLGGVGLQDVKALPVEERNARLRELKAAHLSVRQIERLTGIGRNIVQRA